jgi:hypothetical protein
VSRAISASADQRPAAPSLKPRSSVASPAGRIETSLIIGLGCQRVI